VFQQGSIDSIGDRVALAEDSGDLSRLPVIKPTQATTDALEFEPLGVQGWFTRLGVPAKASD
jgi:hypothetical protein